MAPTAVELIKRAFAGFETIAKRDPRTPGAVEVDLGKVATEIAKAATTFGAAADADAFERSIDELGTFLEKATYDAATDRVYSAATEVAKRVAFGKAADAPQYTHEGGNPTPPAKGSKEQKQNQYTAEGGLANETGAQYTESAGATVATTPSGAPAIGFDQPAGGPTKKAATAKAAESAKPTRTNEGAAQAAAEDGEPTISEGKQGRRAAKRVATGKAAGHVTTEEVWARDMAAMTGAEVAEVRKAAKAQASADPEEDEAPAAKAKAKKAGKPDCKAHDGGGAEGSEVDEVKSKKAGKPFGGADENDDDAKDGEDDGEGEAPATDDRSAADAKAKKTKKQGGAEGGRAAGAEDVDTVDEDDSEETVTEKAADDEWPSDLSPAISPVEKAQRLPVGQIGAKANGARVVAKRHAEVRKAALEPEEIPGDELSPDQVTELRKRAKLTPAQRRRANAKRLREKGYTAGSREIEVDGIDDAAVASEE